jgi:outer membrane protein assembly complex protein YaeT
MFLFALLPITAKAGTTVRIEGMSGKSERQILQWMGGRLEHIRLSPASSSRADDAAFILRELLRHDGYASTTVEWRIAGSDEIVLTVREGARLSLGKVAVTGVAREEERKFARLFAKPAEKGREPGAGAAPFREGDVETGLSYLCQELYSRGHWEARAAVTTRNTNPATGAVDMEIEVTPGPLFHIGRPVVTGDDAAAEKVALSAAEPFAGKTASTVHLGAMRHAVEQAVGGKGYPDVEILMTRTLTDRKLVPGFSVKPGERVRLGRVGVDGLERTQPDRITGLFKNMEGGWYDKNAVNQKLRGILATGAFASARVENTPSGDGTVDATLHFEEARAREIMLGAGVGSYQGFITRAGYIDRNLFGSLMGFNAGLELSFLGLLGEVRVTDPWLLDSDVAGGAKGYALIYGREGYTSYETGLEGTLTWKPSSHYAIELLAGTSVVNLTDDGLPSSELGENNYTNPRLRLTQTLDFRGNPVLPESGWHLKFPLEIGAAVADTSTTYASAGLSGGWYHKLDCHYDIGLGGGFGMLVPSGDGSDLPIDLRLFNGGARSVRSFPERELGPAVNGYPTGGEAMWNANVELIRGITDAVRAVAFFDAGSLSRDYDEITSADIELAAGLGLRLDLPIGPVRFEYGFNLTRDSGEPAGTFHFAIGTAY